jgi:riboflavin kinase
MESWSTITSATRRGSAISRFDVAGAILRGRVVSGLGNFHGWISRLHDHYFRKTGLHLYPGTLNLQLDHDFSFPAGAIRLEKEEYGGTVSVNLLPCRVFSRPAFLLRTDASEAGAGHHPKSVIEVATDVNLRETYSLMDGSIVEVELPVLE